MKTLSTLDVAGSGSNGLDTGWLGLEPKEFRRPFKEMLKFKSVPAGQLLHASDDHADVLMGLASGHLALRTPLVSGEEIVAHVCPPGFWLGVTMISSLAQRRHIAAVARTDVTVAVVPIPVLRRALKDNPLWWPSIARLLEVHWNLTACIGRDLMLRRHRDRITATLLRLTGLRPNPVNPAPDLRIPVTHEEVAAMSNCSKSFVHAELRRLQGQGGIELAYGSIRIRSPQILMASLTK